MYIFPKELNCYVCHGKCLGIYCSNCLRCYCQRCASKNEVVDSCLWAMFIKKCSQCVQFLTSLEKWENFVAIRPVRREFINTVLIKILGWCGKIPRLLIKSDSFFMDKIDPMHKPFSFLHVREKIKNSLYRCSEELVMDLKTIQHILLASPKDSFDQRELREGSKYLDLVIKELRFVDECPSCVLNHVKMCQPSFLDKNKQKHSNFSYPCPWPHALVLARVRGYSLWPAKVLHYNVKKKIVHVLFFGTYERGFVNLKSIFHARDPHEFPKDYEKIKKRVHSKTQQYDIAIKELKNYIECLKLGFPDKVHLSKEFKKPWLPKDTIYQFDYNVFNPPKNDDRTLEDKQHYGYTSNDFQFGNDDSPSINVPAMLKDFQDEIAAIEKESDSCDESEMTSEIVPCIHTSHQDHSDTLSVDSHDSNFEPMRTTITLVSSLMDDVSISSSIKEPTAQTKDDTIQVADDSTMEYQFPEYVEENSPNYTIEEDGISSSSSADSSMSSEDEMENENEKISGISIEDLKRRALDDGLWKNLRVKLERYEVSDSEELSEGMAEELSEELAEDLPAELPEGQPEGLPDLLCELPEELPQEPAEELPEELQVDLPAESPELQEGPGERSQPGGATREEVAAIILMSSSECLSDSSIEITCEIYEDSSEETSAGAISLCNKCPTMSTNSWEEHDCSRFSIEYSDVDDDDDDSMSDVFPCIDHRIIDESDNETV